MLGPVAWSQTPVDTAEAENGILTGVIIDNSVAGFSGTGYITGLDDKQDKVTVTLKTPEKAFYSLVIRYRSPYGKKIQDLIINDSYATQVDFPQTNTFADLDVGKYLLNAGQNTITIQSNWGWMDIDKFSIYLTERNSYNNITRELVDVDADSCARSLYDFFRSHFNKKIISGQTDSYYNYIKELTGKAPLLRSWDFQHYTVGYPYHWENGDYTFGWEDDGSVQEAINWYDSTDRQGIVSFQWHWHSPSGGNAGTNTFYTSETTFDVTKAVQPGTQENTEILRDIDSIASQLKRLQDKGVPVLWRPLHEAGGGWFWWGAKGPQPCKQLYAILYDRLMNFHHLHNLIWVWSSPEKDWYPGNDSVDIVGYDSYPDNFNYGIQKYSFDRLYKLTNGEKMIAMSENGSIPVPDDCLDLDAPWLYFMAWSDLVVRQNTEDHIREVYSNTNVLSVGFAEDTSSTAIPFLQQKNAFRIYPNPATNEIHVKGAPFTHLKLIDLYGRVVLNATGKIKTLNISSLKTGIYFLEVHDKLKTDIFKILINK